MNKKTTGLVLGLLAFLLILIFADLEPGKPAVTATFAVAMLMAIWWVTEALPLSITALLPLVLFPVLKVQDGRLISAFYMNHIILVFIGGFMMALAMEKWNLHKRIALKILMTVGGSPGKILLGFMLASAFLSMWISNTATAMMMIPVVISVIAKLEENMDAKTTARFSVGLLLGIAYSCSIGGMATLVGTPTNLVLPRILSILYPAAPEISFASWFFFALPLTIIMFVSAWGLIYRIYGHKINWNRLEPDHFQKAYKSLGKRSYEETIVLILFVLMAMLWLTRTGIAFERFTIPGWTSLFGSPEFINDGTVAIFISIMLFIAPASKEKKGQIMDLKTTQKLPWHIVFLFGGGFALAEGFQVSGLSIWFGEQLSWAAGVHPLLLMIIVVTLMSFLTELTSNVASTQMLLPVFAVLAVSSGNNPLLLMIPATLASSLAFMLPTATPPNAIIFGTDRIRINSMVRTGFLLNMIGVLLVSFFIWWLGDLILDLAGGVPSWVN